MPWTASDIPEQSGRVVVVTGPTSGLGEAATVALASRGAHVVLAARSQERSEALITRIRDRHPSASLAHVTLDLADLASVRAAGAELLRRHDRIDVVMANAGIMAPPLRRTADGFELQTGVNHLGHVALTALLLPAVLAADAGRVVVVSSGAHRIGGLDLDDLNWRRRPYRRWPAYGQSKLANLLYVAELQRRLDAAGATAIAVAAHPGYTRTNLQTAGPTMGGGLRGAVTGALTGVANLAFGQPVAMGVLPQLYAATALSVPGASYWGPDGPAEARGRPTAVGRSDAARDPALARDLWERSEELVGLRADLPG